MPATGVRPRPHPLVSLISRLLVAQASAATLIGLAYSRRTVASVVTTVVVVAAVCGLAGLVRSGSHAGWLVAVSVESCFAAAGVFWFAYAGYLGGTLLALITLGTLLHPRVARAFAPLRRAGEAASSDQGSLADPAGEVLPGRALG
ncbi:MAG TPA: hypothetical protein VGI58_07635 [Streptosporangiaceae bacterium]